MKTAPLVVGSRPESLGTPSGAHSPGRRRTISLLLALPVVSIPVFPAAAPGGSFSDDQQSNTQADHKILSQYEYRLVAVVSDLMLPNTDSPGAVAAGVPQFIDRFLANWNTASERAHFLEELHRVNALSRANCHSDFLQLDVAAQCKILRQLEAESLGTPSGALLIGRKPFFRLMKEYLTVGYYTSEVGATQELQWTAIPGRYVGCTPCIDRAARAAAPL